jgi:hypothetical protein
MLSMTAWAICDGRRARVIPVEHIFLRLSVSLWMPGNGFKKKRTGSGNVFGDTTDAAHLVREQFYEKRYKSAGGACQRTNAAAGRESLQAQGPFCIPRDTPLS